MAGKSVYLSCVRTSAEWASFDVAQDTFVFTLLELSTYDQIPLDRC